MDFESLSQRNGLRAPQSATFLEFEALENKTISVFVISTEEQRSKRNGENYNSIGKIFLVLEALESPKKTCLQSQKYFLTSRASASEMDFDNTGFARFVTQLEKS
jgi:hypothetical protein